VPERTEASFYRTAAGAEIDLVLELPGTRIWAIEIKRGVAPRATKGFHIALDDIGPEKAFIVYTGDERFPKGKNIEALGMGDLAKELVAAE
jgi:predicted AAA+ superfamily ATPase